MPSKVSRGTFLFQTMTESLPETLIEPAQKVRRSFSTRFSMALSRLLVRLKVDDIPHIKRIIVTVVGGTIMIFGVALIWAPAPTSLLIPLGLAVLGTEYAWARRWMRKGRVMAGKALVKTQEMIGIKDKAD